jgi:hypothetical protein
MIWNALKPALAILILIWIIFSLFDAVGVFLLIVPCMVIFFGSFALAIKILIDRYSTCNSAQTPHNVCNDPLYCCVYYATVPSCAGLGPCPGSGVNTANDLKVNADLEMFGIFVGIFFFVELFIVLLTMSVLSRLKRLKAAAILTNKMLIKYYETGEEEEEEEGGPKGGPEDDEEKNVEESGNRRAQQSEISVNSILLENDPSRDLAPHFDQISTKPRERSSTIGTEIRKKKIIKSNDPTSKRSAVAPTNKMRIQSANVRNEGRSRRTANSRSCAEVRIPIGSRTKSKQKQIGERDDFNADEEDNGACKRCGKESCFDVRHRFENVKSLCSDAIQKISSKLYSVYYYCFYHLNTFTIYEMYNKKNDDIIYLSKKHRRKRNYDKKKPTM